MSGIRKARIVTLVVAALMVLLTACLASGKGEKLTVIVHSEWRPTLEVISKEFAHETGVQVEIVSQAWNDTHDKIVSAALGGSPVDIIYVDTIWPAEFTGAGFLLPLDKYISPEMKAGMEPVLLEQLTVNGRVMAMPNVNEAKWLYYNKQMLAAAGFQKPPRTWEELEEMSRKMMSMGIADYGTAWGWAQAEGLTCDWTLMLYGFGGRWRDESGKWVFNDKAGQNALQWMVSTISPGGVADPGSISLNDITVLKPFMAGKIPFVINWSFAWNMVNNPAESQVAGKVGVTLIPGCKKAGTFSSSVTGGGGYGIIATSPHPDLAWQLVKRLTTRESQTRGLEIASTMPIWKDMYTDPKILKRFPQFEEMGKQYPYAHFRPILSWYTEWSENMQVELHRAFLGKKTVKQALDDAVEFSNRLSAKYGN